MKALFWRKLDTLLRHHLPLMEALEVLRKESHNAAERRRVEGLLTRLRAGQALSRAVQADAVVTGLLLCGERAGDLRGAVARVAERLERQGALRAQMIGATVYPALVLCLCVVLAAVLSAVVLPRFERLFVTLGVAQNLPVLTRWVMDFGQAMRGVGGWALAGLVTVVAGLLSALRGPRAGRLLWRLPLVGRLWQTAHREAFFQTLGLLLKSGTPVDEALRVMENGLAETPLGEVARAAAGWVGEGTSLAAALRRSGAFEESQVEMIAMAERGGSVAESAEHLAGLLRERLGVELKAAMALLEPALIIFMAGLVALMVVALFLPLGPLVSRLSEGG